MYHSQIGKDNLVKGKFFFSAFHLPKRDSIYGFGNRRSLSLSLSLSLSFKGGERPLRPPLDPPLHKIGFTMYMYILPNFRLDASVQCSNCVDIVLILVNMSFLLWERERERERESNRFFTPICNGSTKEIDMHVIGSSKYP